MENIRIEDYLEDTIVRLFGTAGDELAETGGITFNLMPFDEWQVVATSDISTLEKLNDLAKERKCYYIAVTRDESLTGVVVPIIQEDRLVMLYESRKGEAAYYASILLNLMALEVFGSELCKKPVRIMPLGSVCNEGNT